MLTYMCWLVFFLLLWKLLNVQGSDIGKWVILIITQLLKAVSRELFLRCLKWRCYQHAGTSMVLGSGLICAQRIFKHVAAYKFSVAWESDCLFIISIEFIAVAENRTSANINWTWHNIWYLCFLNKTVVAWLWSDKKSS